ncbi:MAG: hypothetical protein JW902_04055 [Syntrophaceae bacterium]|nr:hypothetical protein [Syntrophaceae bacterium]
MKIMNRFRPAVPETARLGRLKITGAVVLTLVAIAGVYVFWPTKTKPIAELKDAKHLQKKEKAPLQAHPKTARRDKIYPKDSQFRKPKSRPPEWNQKQSSFTDTGKASPRYADSLQPPKSSRQLSGMRGRYYARYPGIAGRGKMGEPVVGPPQWQPERFNVEGRDRMLEFPMSIRPERPTERSMPGLPEGAELKIPQEQLKKMNEAVLLHILEEYKDNPEQAEQIKKILLERLEHFNKQSNANDKEPSDKK